MGIKSTYFTGDVLKLLETPPAKATDQPSIELRLEYLRRTAAKAPPPPAVSVLVLCVCRHSPAAHARSGGQECSFCWCREFRAWVEPVPAVHDPMPGDVVAALTNLAKEPAFKDLALEHLAALGRAGRRRFFSEGMILADVGDRSDALYLILTGSAQADRPDHASTPDRSARIGPGEIVGAVDVLRGLPRGTAIRAAEDLVVLELPRKIIQQIFRQDGKLYRAFLRMVHSRLNAVASGVGIPNRGEQSAGNLLHPVAFVQGSGGLPDG